MPTDTEIAWAAGLFEGEGSLIPHHRKRYAAASLTTTDLDVLERFQAILGFGKITVQRKSHPNRKQCYSWNIWSAAQTRELVTMFWPYLGERRRARAQEVLATANAVGTRGQSKYQTHCKRGHEFTEENTYRQKQPASPKGWTRRCRQCIRDRQREMYQAKTRAD